MPTAAHSTSPILIRPKVQWVLLLCVQCAFVHSTCGSVQARILAFSGACVSSPFTFAQKPDYNMKLEPRWVWLSNGV